MSSKYPRTYHLPWSPGGTNDDKKLPSIDGFLSRPGQENILVITEKLDGSNSCLTTEGVFARSHGKISTHPAFDYLKGIWAGILGQLEPGEEIFGENCFAVHSITYDALSSYFFVFNIRKNGRWLSYDEVVSRAQELGLTTVPLLYRGVILSEKEFISLTNKTMKEKSFFGGEREGFVVRTIDSFKDNDFSTNVAKYVRANHVQTSDHWMHQKITKQVLKKL